MTNAQKYAIDSFLSEDIQAIFGIIIMPATVMGLLAQFLIHPYLNEIFELYNSKEFKKIKKILFKIILIIFAIGMLCCVVGYFLGTPVLGFVYGIDLSQYSVQLTMILFSATFYTMAGIISPILITMRCNLIQFIIYTLISLFELVLSNVMIFKAGFDGAIWAYLITMILYFGVFYIVAMRIIKSKEKVVE